MCTGWGFNIGREFLYNFLGCVGLDTWCKYNSEMKQNISSKLFQLAMNSAHTIIILANEEHNQGTTITDKDISHRAWKSKQYTHNKTFHIYNCVANTKLW